jgi:hypothetical protein
MKRVIILAMLLAGTANAQFLDGNKLLSNLKESDAFSRGLGMGYILGVYDFGAGTLYCAPSNATAGQIKDMILNYLDNIPAERHIAADITIMKVLKAVWPCAKRGSAL